MPATATMTARSRARAESPEPALRVVAANGKTSTNGSVKPLGDKLAKQYAPCRSLGHTWEHVGLADPLLRPPMGRRGCVGIVSTCRNCGTERTKWMVSRTGEILPGRYKYPEGYQHDRKELDEPAPSLAQWRRTYLAGLGV